MNRLIYLNVVFTSVIISFLLFSCESTEEKQVKKEELVEYKDGIYTEYYPGKKAIKFRGPKDSAQRRHGRWYFYSENGTEMSITEYKHGLKSGISMVRYPNGVMHYIGNYENDQPSGRWTTYDEQGKVANEYNYDTIQP